MSREIFIDTANVEDILTWSERGVVDGVTTNQKIFLSDGVLDVKESVMTICDVVRGLPVSVELTTSNVQDQVAEGLLFGSWRPNIVVKVPMTVDGNGLQVITLLSKAGLATNATLMMTAEQLILAARAGAHYISLFVNRARDGGEDPYREIGKARRFLVQGGYRAKIIAGSIRAPRDVSEAYDAGADIVTIPPRVLEAILNHPKTAETVAEFDAAWAELRRRARKLPVPAAEPAPAAVSVVEISSGSTKR